MLNSVWLQVFICVVFLAVYSFWKKRNVVEFTHFDLLSIVFVGISFANFLSQGELQNGVVVIVTWFVLTYVYKAFSKAIKKVKG